MSFIKRVLKQTATWWDLAASPYDSYGDPSLSSPVTLQPSSGTGVRWESRSEKFIKPNGDEDHGRAIVYSATTEFAVGDYLFLGSSSASNPETVTGADRVKYAERCPDVKNSKILYKAIL